MLGKNQLQGRVLLKKNNLGAVSFFRHIFLLQTLCLICMMTTHFPTVILTIQIKILFSPTLILILSLHLYYVSSCYASSHCSKNVNLRKKILNVLVNKRYLYTEIIIYVVSESKRSWFLIILSGRNLLQVDRVLSMFGIFLWNILCSF